MGFFQDLFGTSGDASKAAAVKSAGIQAGLDYATPLYQQGRSDITSGYGQAQNLFAPIVAGSQAGAGAYGDITGANGPEGYARALQSFQTSPGYDFTKNAALEATQRLGGTGGFQNSGNVQTALQDRATQLANTEFGNYVSRLQPYLGYSLGATAGGAGAAAGEANALNASDISQAGLGANAQAGIGASNAAGILGDAASRQAGINNILKIGGAALGAVTGVPIGSIGAGGTGGAGGTSLASQLLGYLGNSGGNAVSNSDPYGLGNYNYNFGVA